MPHPPNRLNAIRLVQGATKRLRLTVRKHDGRPQSLVDAKVVMTLRRAAGTDPLFTKEIGSGVTVEDVAKGVALIKLDPSDTTELAAGTYRYDVWIELPGTPPERYAVVEFAELTVVDTVTPFST